MNTDQQLITKFYTSFQNKDYRGMQECYHDDIQFSDAVFTDLKGKQAKAMWHMLVEGGKDLRIAFRDDKAQHERGSCHWEAWYTFSKTGRKVHNIIDAAFEFREGKIYRHDDHFSFYRWSGMALGTTGKLLGWTSFLHNKIRETARKNLQRFIDDHPEYA
jgi:ketosteroid isomerase-like protein